MLTGIQYNNHVISREVVGNKVYGQSNMCEENPCSEQTDADIDNALRKNRQFESLALEAADRKDEKQKTIGTNNNGTTMKYTIQTKTMPCCSESIGTHACVELRNRRPYHFRTRCKTDADFGMLQCCLTCRTDISKLGQELFSQGTRSRHCFDRHNRKFCQHFVHQGGMWAANQKKQVSCNGESASLAFRICRRSCGFCNLNLYEEDRKSTKCPTNIAISTAPKHAKKVAVIYPGIGGGQVSVTTEISISIKLPSTHKPKQVTAIPSLPTRPITPPLPSVVGSPEPPLVMPPPPPVVLPSPTLPPSTQRPPQPPPIFPEPWWPNKPYIGPQPMTITWRPVPNPWPVPPYPTWPTQTDIPPSATNWPQPWDHATHLPPSTSLHFRDMLEEIMDIELDLDSSSVDLLQEILLDDIKQ